MAKLQGLIFEEELIREEMCCMVSLKQLLKSVFLKVWICARLSHPKSTLLPPHSLLCHVLAQGADGAGYGHSTGFPTSTKTLDRSSHTAQGSAKLWEIHRDIPQSRNIKLGFSSGKKDEGKRKAMSYLRRCSGCRQVWSCGVGFREYPPLPLSTRNGEGVLMLCLQFDLSYCPVLLNF